MRSLFASLALGSLLPLAFAPFGLWWLTPILVAAQALVWADMPVRAAFWRGFAFGAGAFLSGTYWLYHSVVTIGKVPLPLALLLVLGMVAIMALYFGLNAAVIVRIARARLVGIALLLPVVWVPTEWLRGWVLSGFPWLSLGYSLPDTPLGGWLPLGGVYLGSFVILAIASTLLMLTVRKTRLIAVVFGVALSFATFLLHGHDWTRDAGKSLTVNIGQLGLDQSLKWERSQFQKTLQWYAEFVAAADGDVLIMPEVAIPALADSVDGYLQQLAQITAKREQSLVLGILRRPEGEDPSNALLVMQSGTRQWYEKRHLVPFGEFFPVPAFVRNWMRLRGLPYSNVRAGDRNQRPVDVGGFSVATSICYEDAYASEQLLFFPESAFIINISNDAWFGDTIAPHQHLQIARTRSAESERWQARSTNAGITALIDQDGRIVSQAPAFEPATLSGRLTMRAGHTPYTKTGNWPVLLLSLFGFSLIALRYKRR